MDDENFNLDSSPTSSDNEDTRASEVPHSPSNHRQQQQQQQQQALRTGQAGSRRGNMTADVTSFFEVRGDKKLCKFCL